MIRLFNNPLEFVGYFLAFLAAITVHEFAHAWTADRLGDPTSRLMGRLTLNPIAHLDLIGTIMILFAPFGWAKPVQVDPFNFRHPQKDMAITSLAGPAANLILAGLCSILLRLISGILLTNIFGAVLNMFIELIIVLNVNLAIFNLIPISPLDGYGVVGGLLKPPYDHQWAELKPYGIIFLIFLVFPIFGCVAPITQFMTPVINFILSFLLPAGGIL
jgi:Zn-dependent protease